MKAALTHAVDDVRIVDMPVPELFDGEILVAMKTVGICGSDLHPWYVGSKTPAVLGHEPAGVVYRVAPDVTNVSPGDRVFVHHHASCGTCPLCRAGEPVMCPDWRPARLHPGGLAELVRVESAVVRNEILHLPAGLGFDDGSLIEPVACGVKAVRRGSVRPGDTVAVIGLGANGVLLGLLCRDLGAARLIGSDPDPARRRLAEPFGFDRTIDPEEGLAAAAREATGGRGADVVFVLPTAAGAFQSAMEAAAPAGRVVFYSPVEPGKTWPLAAHEAYRRDLTLRFSYSAGPSELRAALDLIERGIVRASRLVTHRFPLARAAEAFRTAAAGGLALKVMIEI